MKICRWIAGLALLLVAGCGPIIGAAMVSGGGVKDLRPVIGQLNDLKPGSRVLVVGPFDRTDQAFYICRGEDASNFTTAFNTSGLFQADFYLGDRFGDLKVEQERLRHLSPQQLQQQLGLKNMPDLLVTGVILKRSTVAAPAQGVLMDVSYRLEFYDLRRQQVTSVEIRVKDLFQDCIVDAVDGLAARLTGG